MQALQKAKTKEQGALFLKSVATIDFWANRNVLLDKFWGMYCSADNRGNDWFRWAAFATEGIPATLPNANPIESWHNSGVRQCLKGRMKASTAYVLEKAIPDVLESYGVQLFGEK